MQDSLQKRVDHLIRLGHYLEAKKVNLKLIDYFEKEQDWHQIANSLFISAKIKEQSGENPAPEYLRVLQLCEKHELISWRILTLQKMAYVHKDLGEPDLAVSFSQRAYDLQSKIYGKPKAGQVVNLAWFHYENKSYDKAIQLLALGEKLFASDIEGIRMIYHGWLELYLFKSLEFEKALKYINKSIALPIVKSKWRHAKLLANKARAEFALGHLSKAIESQLDAMEYFFPEFNRSNPQDLPELDKTSELRQFWLLQHYAIYLLERARQNSNRGDLIIAQMAANRSVEMLNHFRPHWNRNERYKQARFYRANDEIIVDINYELWKQTKAPKYVERIFQAIEFGRSRSDLEYRFRDFNGDSMIVQRDILTEQLQQLLLEHQFSNANQRDSALHAIDHVNRKIQAFDAKINVTSPNYFAPKKIEAHRTAHVQSKLTSDQAYVSYFSTGSQAGYHGKFLYTLILTSDTVHLLRQEQDQLISRGEAYHQQLKTQATNFDSVGCILYQQLVDPIAFLLADRKDWIVTNDYTISMIPFEILRPCEGIDKNNYLLQQKNIKYTLGAHHLLDKRTLRASKGMLALAPEFDGNWDTNRHYVTRGELVHLPGAKQEIEILRGLSVGNFQTGRTATKSHFLNEAGKYRFIHLATHAIIDGRNPDASRLVFAPDQGNRKNEELLAAEIYALDIPAELVTLSACNTGIGKSIAGEGVTSLAKAFTLAGARNVLMSLWPVEDALTADLMKDFYEALKEGLAPSKALKEAKLLFIKNHPGTLKHPYYWAGFVLSGAHERDTYQAALPTPKSYSWLIVSVLISALSLLFVWNLKIS